MKMIMAALTATTFLTGAVAPASAGTDVTRITEQIEKAAGSETVIFVKERRDPPRQMEYDASKLPFGSSAWRQQVERERGGRGR